MVLLICAAQRPLDGSTTRATRQTATHQVDASVDGRQASYQETDYCATAESSHRRINDQPAFSEALKILAFADPRDYPMTLPPAESLDVVGRRQAHGPDTDKPFIDLGHRLGQIDLARGPSDDPTGSTKALLAACSDTPSASRAAADVRSAVSLGCRRRSLWLLRTPNLGTQHQQPAMLSSCRWSETLYPLRCRQRHCLV